MPLYFSTYKFKSTKYPGRWAEAATQFYARNYGHALQTLKMRNLDEHVCRPPLARPGIVTGVEGPPEMPSDLLRQGRLAEAMHAAIYMGFLAHACEATEGYDLLHDIGVLHEVGHLLLFDAWEKAGSLRNHYKATGRDKEIIAEVEALERRIPGFHPSWSGVEEHPAVPFPQRLAWARDRIAEPDWYAQDIPEDAPRVFFG